MKWHDRDWLPAVPAAGSLAMAALGMILAACAGSKTPTGNGGTVRSGLGTAQVDIELVPTGTDCIIITVVGPEPSAQTVTFQYTLPAQASSTFSLVGLPLGTDSFSAISYSVACPPGTTPQTDSETYASNTATAAVSMSPAVTVMLYMGNGTGEGAVGVNFPGVSITEIALYPQSAPWGITTGPDGNLWFTENISGIGYIGQLSTSGVVNLFGTPTQLSYPHGITAGPDGNLWFTEFSAHNIGSSSISGSIKEFPVPSTAETANLGLAPDLITAGPDGNLWFTDAIGPTVIDSVTEQVGVITTNGMVSSADVHDLTDVDSSPPLSGIAAGSDGNLWSIDYAGLTIYVSSTSGALISTYSIPGTDVTASRSQSYGFAGIAAGPDGNLWFTSASLNIVGRITTAGVITPYAIPTALSLPSGIAAGPDGNIWFAEFSGNKIGRVTLAPGAQYGTITEFTIPTAGSSPIGITAGPDSNIWFTESVSGKIGKLVLF
jgi:streptogramin lyase